MLISPFRPCEGSPTFQEEYRGDYVPSFIDAWHGPQIVAPDTPYVAATGKKSLYFIDTRFDPDTAKHIKEQIERATTSGGPDQRISIDELSATAQVENAATGETVFVFDPLYARVFFARGINKRNPALKLPEHELAGDWLSKPYSSAMLLPLVLTCASTALAVILPGPPGPYPVALKAKTFEDSARWDPYAPRDAPEKRRVLVSAFIPVKQQNCSGDVVPYMPLATAQALARLAEPFGVSLPHEIFSTLELEFCKVADSCKSRRDSRAEEYPLVVFSPGRGGSRLAYGVLTRALASYGYIVVSLDSTYETNVIEFPDGSVVRGVNEENSDKIFVEELIETRRADVSFIIDQLTTPSIAAELLSGTRSKVDSDKIFVYGHSLGGATAAASLHADNRVRGGLNFDGGLLGPVTVEGTDKPFVLVGTPGSAQNIESAGFPPWNQTWNNLRGPSLMVTINGTVHQTFLDAPQLPTIRALLQVPEYSGLVGLILGSIDGQRVGDLIVGLVRSALSVAFDGKTGKFCSIEDLGPEIVQPMVKGVECA
ncbi:putative 1-alkyl-2-acetylglycerophosphocholine esterase [Colletotrichum spinosum]|uniref:1-alkyl-2-acetylglycerophosphocholine esterase n=1 Tax=Colletotrichum spinosum TaxID=1347390 RepID=A0A4R8QCL8_9PEZI|nr:putative 1-alkyl-2-acetylglycerophosphocholine esterase [Colletotrichum spinosum]